MKRWVKAEATSGDAAFNADRTSGVAGAIGDPSIKYFGRWDFSSESQYISSWGGAYIMVNFTGTSAKLITGNVSNFYASIDGGPWVSYLNMGGTINLTPQPLPSGIHSLRVAQGRDYDYTFKFQGFLFDVGAVTSAPETSQYLIEYVGDSITAGYMDPQSNVSDYAWVCSENMGVEHTQIAFPGVNLVSGYTGVGMDTYYFNEQDFNDSSPTPWAFTQYTANAVVSNLGTNDNGNGVPDEIFQNSYTTFLQNIRSRYPDAEIFVLQTFGGLKIAPTKAAVSARIAAGDTKVQYVDTTGWLTPSVDYVDGIHPTVSGHIKVASRLQPILAPYVGASSVVPSLANGNYKVINRNSGLALDVQGQRTADGTPIQQVPYNGGLNQQWTLTKLPGTQYTITSVQSGKVLDVTGQQLGDGVDIELYEFNGGSNQEWIIQKLQNGYFTVQALQSYKMMDVTGQSIAPKALVEQLTSHGYNSQQWAFQQLA